MQIKGVINFIGVVGAWLGLRAFELYIIIIYNASICINRQRRSDSFLFVFYVLHLVAKCQFDLFFFLILEIIVSKNIVYELIFSLTASVNVSLFPEQGEG